MHVIIWEYQVKTERIAEFEDIYSPNGTWTKLFHKSKGFLGTELLRDIKDPHRYITIDRWASPQDHESFLLQWKTAYDALDNQCSALTSKEVFLGNWDLR
ncbi:MAG TPA: antibiotic biosynthesis monooxygenase family protein [Anaerolineales bacterium]|nr:antibiotic biosynthesis monooxygenase family protein [Anaerolineales bacterium]